MSVVIALLTCILCEDILRIMRTPENIFEGAYAYLLVTFIGVPCTFFYNLLSSIIRALGDSKTPFWFLLFAAVLNIILDLFCILVLDWGVAGAAIATVFSQGLSAVLCYIYMYRKFEILQGTRKNAGSSRNWLRRCSTSVCLWDCSFLSRLSAASCFRVRIMPWERRVWQPLRLLCASRCSLSVRSRVWALRWLHIADRITERVNRNVFG